LVCAHTMSCGGYLVAVAASVAHVDRRIFERLERQSIRAAALGVRGAPPARLRVVVRQSAGVGPDRLRRTAVARGRRMTNAILHRSRLPDPFRDGLDSGWKTID